MIQSVKFFFNIVSKEKIAPANLIAQKHFAVL